MADLASLMNVAPITAGGMIMSQNDSELATAQATREELAQKIQELQLKNQQSVGMNPLLQQFQQGLNDTQQANLPGLRAKSLQEQILAQKNQGTLGTDITAGNSDNLEKVRKNKSADLDSLYQDMMKYSGEMERTPVPMRAAALHDLMVGGGHNMDDPASATLLRTITSDPENMPQNLVAAAQHLGQIKKSQDPTYLAHTEGVAATNAAHLEGIREQGKNQLAVTDRQIAAGRFQKTQASTDFKSVIDKQLLRAGGDPIKTYTILTQNAQIAQSNGLVELASELTERANAVYPAAKAAMGRINPNQVDPNQQGLPTRDVPDFRPPGGGATPRKAAGTATDPIVLK